MAWTDERVQLLKKLWSEGLSASQIAGRLGSITRNAVVGKIHRLGLSGRATTSRMKTHRPRRNGYTKEKKPKNNFVTSGKALVVANLFQGEPEGLPVVQEEFVIPLAERKTVDTLKDCSCRWPIGDPLTSDFHFCGKNKVPELPYCEHHARRAFQPRQRTRKKVEELV